MAIQYQPVLPVDIQFGAADRPGVIGDDFTFARVRMAAAAIARTVRARHKLSQWLVAHDCRFFSDEFARAAARVLEREGIHAILTSRPTPAAAVSFEIKHQKLDGGIHITGGSDPAQYSGLRFFDASGTAFGRDQSAEIGKLGATMSREDGEADGAEETELETTDPSPAYFDRLGELVRLDAIRSARLTLAYDAMHGACAGWLDRFFIARDIPVQTLRVDRDVLFGGQAPDPAPANLELLAQLVRQSGAALGLATDGDGERFGILDGRGRFVAPGHIFGLVYDYLVESRGWRLGAARSVGASRLVDAVARHHDLQVYETGDGFDHFARFLKRDQVAVAVAEDGRLTIRGHVPESDGMLTCLLAAEMVAERGPLDTQLMELFRRVGAEFWPVSRQVRLSRAALARLTKWMASEPGEFLGWRVIRAERSAGLKLEFESGAWLLLQPRGDGPDLKIYAEARSLDEANRLAKESEQWVLR